MTMEQSGHELI